MKFLAWFRRLIVRGNKPGRFTPDLYSWGLVNFNRRNRR